jgi:16S rRNA processing protein RimM
VAERVCVARIGAPHGVRGELRLWVFTEDPAAIGQFGPLQSDDGRSFEIASLRPAKDHFVARLKGVDDRNAAEALTNVELYVPRDRLPAAEDGTFYHADLIGLDAVSVAGDALGSVVAVHNFGAGDLLELKPVSGGGTVLIPFTATCVPEVDIQGRRLVVDPPDGTFEPSPDERA